MRMAGAVTIGVVILEVLLAGAFLLGFFWLGDWQAGLLCAGVLLLLIVLPWMGELKLVFDSAGPKGAVRVGWWGRATFAVGESATRVVVRVLGIPIRRTLPRKPAEEPEAEEEVGPEAEPEPAPEAEPTEKPTKLWKRVNSDTIEGVLRALGSATGATCELVWGAEEIRVSVQDPVGQEMADSALEQVVGSREVGPLDLTVSTGPGERRVRAIYRIGLLRAALAGVQMAIDGRLVALARRMKKAREEPAAEVVDEDERIIEQIVEQDASREEDEE